MQLSRRAAHRAVLAAVAAASLLVPAARPGAAQIPVTDVAHIAVNSTWHYAHYLQFALQIVQQYEQITHQVEQIRNQLLALRKLENPSWREIASLLYDLDFLMRLGRSLGFTLGNAADQFAATFPGWQPWTDPAQVSAQTTRALDTMRAGLAALARQASSLGDAEQTLASIRQQMVTTRGTQQALEQLATVAAVQAQEQVLARQSLAVAANLAAVANGYWIDREAQSRAGFTVLARETALAADQNRSPGWTFVPSWWPFF